MAVALALSPQSILFGLLATCRSSNPNKDYPRIVDNCRLNCHELSLNNNLRARAVFLSHIRSNDLLRRTLRAQQLLDYVVYVVVKNIP